MKKTAYLFQTFIILAWWMAIWQWDEIYSIFAFSILSRDLFFVFFVPDLFCIVLLSLLNAYFSNNSFKYIILGAFAYATLVCISLGVLSGDGYISIFTMSMGLCCNLFLCFPQHAFRNSNSDSLIVNAAKTCIQIACLWGIALVLIPLFFVTIVGGDTDIHNGNPIFILGVILFLLCSLGGVWGAYAFVQTGQGTPLPLDATNKLVTSGPYQYVRNPMAIFGFGQGVAVSMITWSIELFAFYLVGILAWQFVIRGYEEKDLLEKYGDEYSQYTQNVKCWIPRLIAYK